MMFRVLCTTKPLKLAVRTLHGVEISHTDTQKLLWEVMGPKPTLTDHTDSLTYGFTLHTTSNTTISVYVCISLPSEFSGMSLGRVPPFQDRAGFVSITLVSFRDVSKTTRVSYWKETEAKYKNKCSH